VASAEDDFADDVLAAIEGLEAPFAIATVISVDGSTPPIATVSWKGSETPAKCPRHYTPSAGHEVLMARVKGQSFIIAGY
jgi:hypothetical protein